MRFCNNCQQPVYHVVHFQGFLQAFAEPLRDDCARKQSMVVVEAAAYYGVKSAKPALDK